jgi:hypothetical protein
MSGERDLETLDAAIARVMTALENDNPDPEARDKLERELAIYLEMRLRIAGPRN